MYSGAENPLLNEDLDFLRQYNTYDIPQQSAAQLSHQSYSIIEISTWLASATIILNPEKM